jgi:uncharacterized membrane protein
VAMPESPRWFDAKGRLNEARNALAYVARFNGIPFDKNKVIFDTEHALENVVEEHESDE